jgi:hypothetical protein
VTHIVVEIKINGNLCSEECTVLCKDHHRCQAFNSDLDCAGADDKYAFIRCPPCKDSVIPVECATCANFGDLCCSSCPDNKDWVPPTTAKKRG